MRAYTLVSNGETWTVGRWCNFIALARSPFCLVPA